MAGRKFNVSDFYKPGSEPITIRLDTIRLIHSEPSLDGTVKLKRLVTNDYPQNPGFLVSPEEAEAIKKLILKLEDNTLPKEISHLTTAVRDLWNLLRARMR